MHNFSKDMQGAPASVDPPAELSAVGPVVLTEREQSVASSALAESSSISAPAEVMVLEVADLLVDIPLVPEAAVVASDPANEAKDRMVQVESVDNQTR